MHLSQPLLHLSKFSLAVVFPVPLSVYPRPLWNHSVRTLVSEVRPHLTPEVPCDISRRFAPWEKVVDWNEVVHGSSLDATLFCPRCSQREEDGDELTDETKGKRKKTK